MALRRMRSIAALSIVALAALAGTTNSSANTEGACSAGVHTLSLGSGRTALMRVTPRGDKERRALLLVLHGAHGSASDALTAFRGGWNAHGLVLVAPAARGSSWSVERGSGEDLAAIGHALTQTYARCAIDARRVGIGGFADGATAALSLGMTNGRLFRAIIALSPGRVSKQTAVGRPRIFVAAPTGGGLVPTLRREGYAVAFRPFADGHDVSETLSRAAVRWFLG
jgi:phospholipase/carboxylesterase